MKRPKLETSPVTIDRTPAIPVAHFGKDHWSLLGYIGCRISEHPAGNAEGIGTLDRRHLRCNEDNHPVHNVNNCDWQPAHGTRLAGYWCEDEAGEKTLNPKLLLPQHDDWDCMDDLEAAGIIEVLSEINGFVRITEAGLQVYGALCEHKAAGKNFAGFRWPLK